MTPEELDAIQGRCDVATGGPWENGDSYYMAGVATKRNRFLNVPLGECAYCRAGAPIWEGPADVNGTRMRAHVHRTEKPWYGEGHQIHARPDTTPVCIAGNYDYEQGGIIDPADTEFIVHARTDVPALVAEVRRLQAMERRVRDLADQWDERVERFDDWIAYHRAVKVLREALEGP